MALLGVVAARGKGLTREMGVEIECGNLSNPFKDCCTERRQRVKV